MTVLVEEPTATRSDATLTLRVIAARWESEGVTSYDLAGTDGTPLPAWTPGAHVDLHLPSGTVRQYSLCGDPADRGHYRIAVLELPAGRGGSVEAHRELRPGALVGVGQPRSEFALVDAERYLFVAGGIGITPILPMVREVAARGAEWTLVYGARSAAHFSFTGPLADIDVSRVRFLAQDADGLPDLSAIVADARADAVFCCGPAGLMDALTEVMTARGDADRLHLERFAAAPVRPAATGDGAVDGFEVELASSGRIVTVAPEVTVLDALRAAGVDHPSSCEQGFCGSCETKVVSGVIDHRDDLLTDAERAAGDTMMVCVSRAACPRLVLDL